MAIFTLMGVSSISQSIWWIGKRKQAWHDTQRVIFGWLVDLWKGWQAYHIISYQQYDFYTCYPESSHGIPCFMDWLIVCIHHSMSCKRSLLIPWAPAALWFHGWLQSWAVGVTLVRTAFFTWLPHDEQRLGPFLRLLVWDEWLVMHTNRQKTNEMNNINK